MHVIKLRHMGCPECHNRIEVKNLKLVKGAQFSNLACPACKKVTNSKFWRCDCKHLWHKCSLHVKGSEGKELLPREKQKRRNQHVEKGVDKPLPKLRRIEGNAIDDGSSTRDYFRISLPPGSTLALRFPHLVKNVEEPSHAYSA